MCSVILALICLISMMAMVISFSYPPKPIFRLHDSRSVSKCYNSPRLLTQVNCVIPQFDQNGRTVASATQELITKLKGTCMYIVGMMGTGKSTAGDLLAKKLGYRFLDTDELAEYMIEMPISEYFASGKVAEFRQLEYEILMEMTQYTRLVLSTGGGIVEKNENWGLLRHGVVVFLDMAPEDIYARLISKPEEISKRPLLSDSDPLGKLQALTEERRGKYMQADIRVAVPPSMSAEEVADKVILELLEFIDKNPPLWQSWKTKRDKVAVEAAARMNPSAAAAANVGFGAEGKTGSIQYVALSDIKSGKVKLPGSAQSESQKSNDGDSEQPKSKGFGKQ